MGVITGFIVTVNVVDVAQALLIGVKVYVVVAPKLGAGVQVPSIPLVEGVGSVKGVPTQSGPIGVKVGVTWGVIVTFKVCGLAQGNKIESGLNV